MAEDAAVRRMQGLQREVLLYLLQHPDAKDTVEGIMHWWLPEGSAGVKETDVGLVLAALVGRGWVTAFSRSPGARVYGLNRMHESQIREWLEN